MEYSSKNFNYKKDLNSVVLLSPPIFPIFFWWSTPLLKAKNNYDLYRSALYIVDVLLIVIYPFKSTIYVLEEINKFNQI